MSAQDHFPQESQSGDDARLVKINFPLPEEDHAHGVEAENLWAKPLSDGGYRIENTPFYAYGVSFQDIVAAEEDGGRLVYRGVQSRSGHSTYRILIQNPEGYKDSNFKVAWVPLADLGCTFEVAKSRWLAIDVPALTDVFAVYALLEEGERSGLWTFEEGHCGHSLVRSSKQ